MRKERRNVFLIIIILLIVIAVGGANLFTHDKKGQKTVDNVTQDKETARRQLEIAVFEGGFGKVFYEGAIERFMQRYPDIDIEMIANPRISYIIKPRFVAGDPPDMICEFGVEQLGNMANDGLLIELNDLFEEKVDGEDITLKDKLYDGALYQGAMPLNDGKIYYAPMSMGYSGLYYNKTLFKKMGWEKPTTWKDFFELGIKARNKGIALYAFPGIFPYYNGMVIYPSIKSHAGQKAINALTNYEEGAWTNPKVIDVLEVFERMYQEDFVMEGTLAMNHTQAQAEWLKDKALFIPAGNWLENEMKGGIPEDFEFGFVPAPVFENSEKPTVNFGYGYNAIAKDGLNIEEAKLFLKYLYSDENIIPFSQNNSAVLAVDQAYEMVKDFVRPSVKETFEVGMAKGIDSVTLNWSGDFNMYKTLEKELYAGIVFMLKGEITAEDLAAYLDKRTEELKNLDLN